ncbi:accessory Sec system glycosylation chaperone GtfB [Streptococcus cuniculi]|uniref:UDP-N-acetylglucosamine--peptide N-acetylglucosaminyltransferase stabilizing protein GtfB n=1 Tax=Streptococcus cuniculi TaxID=1432788 RepID=A0A4Y9JCD2_9STRE|nr:accessory Sec system glycosylation chaperone GtfB [Streptococcus cuniculi]MBF0778467.1 accessory Sec system glycosylation chaperone GtfB [Streptococcus cuniculi]TFU97564.1 accessory Sec system glycosylation chaperone GtfB [Streptococcus cuniculi]
MITLFDRFNAAARDLYYSLEASGLLGSSSIVLEEDGGLPAGVTSPYAFFCGMEEGEGEPLYFNEVPLPAFWQITGTNTQGAIYNDSTKQATIHYHEPKHLRLVQTVEWLTPSQEVYRQDHYNQYGWMFARTYFNAEGQAVSKHYYQASGEEVLVENLQTGYHLLNWRGKVYPFAKRTDFYLFYLREAQVDLSAIWYTSLSSPFVLSYYLGGDGQDVLFWQEKIGQEIPGNMRLILSGSAKRTKKIVVQDKESYEKLLQLVSDEEASMISYLGYLYPRHSENAQTKEILILTNSDQLEGMAVLVKELSDYQFHIAALTEMSPRLKAYEEEAHVTLYPNIAPRQVADLFEKCSIYLDINHGSEILSGTRQAFEHNLLIAGFENTVHDQRFVLDEALFSPDAASHLAAWLRGEEIQSRVSRQRLESEEATEAAYQALLGEEGQYVQAE